MLFDKLRLGPLELPNRAVMAPMTRNRAGIGGVPGPLAAQYYRQRAEAGLIVTEGVQPSAIGQGYLNTPGLHTPAQIDGWREVTSAVHAAGGRIFAQLLHTGRVSHPANNGGIEPVAPTGTLSISSLPKTPISARIPMVARCPPGCGSRSRWPRR